MKRQLLWLCVAIVGFTGSATAAAAAPPATMSGENFSSNGGPGLVVCQQSGPFSYTASGTATGPYSGSFSETGTGTISGSSPSSFGSATAFSASFTIRSPSGDVLVTGSKTLSGSGGSFCQDASGNTGGGGIATSYQATIFTPTGNYHDEGTSGVNILFTGPSGTTLRESFLSTLTQPVLIAPTDKDQCKHGGWQRYPQFKNQGDCVSFVATGGKNPPAR